MSSVPIRDVFLSAFLRAAQRSQKNLKVPMREEMPEQTSSGKVVEFAYATT